MNHLPVILRLLIGLAFLPLTVHAEDVRLTIKREARKCATAWQREDYKTIMAYQPPRVIRQAGGHDAMLRELKAQYARVREYGAESLEAIPGQPSEPRQIGQWLTAFVPLTAVLHSAYIDLTQETHALGLSADRGKHWYFILLHQTTQDELNAWFPEFIGKLTLPADPAPHVESVF